MASPDIEPVPSPLWLITKPGGYKHINQFGRVYRTRELALRHCDYNEVVVELRLAHAPEPPAVETNLWRHDWEMLSGSHYRCRRCGTQCLDAHDAALCPARPDTLKSSGGG